MSFSFKRIREYISASVGWVSNPILWWGSGAPSGISPYPCDSYFDYTNLAFYVRDDANSTWGSPVSVAPPSLSGYATISYVTSAIASAISSATSTIESWVTSNFYANTTPLNSITAPTSDVSFNSHKATGLATPTASTDGANKGYVDTAVGAISTTITSGTTTTSGFTNGHIIYVASGKTTDLALGTGFATTGGTLTFTSPVTSVAGHTGVVTLATTDLTDWAAATSSFLTSASLSGYDTVANLINPLHYRVGTTTTATLALPTSIPQFYSIGPGNVLQYTSANGGIKEGGRYLVTDGTNFFFFDCEYFSGNDNAVYTGGAAFGYAAQGGSSAIAIGAAIYYCGSSLTAPITAGGTTFTGGFSIAPGTGITITSSGSTVTISASGGGGGGEPAPPTVTGVAASVASSTSVTVSWTTQSYFSSYNVYYATNQSGPYTNFGNTASSSLTVTGLTSGTTYYFIVTGLITSGGESMGQAPITATPYVVYVDDKWSGSGSVNGRTPDTVSDGNWTVTSYTGGGGATLTVASNAITTTSTSGYALALAESGHSDCTITIPFTTPSSTDFAGGIAFRGNASAQYVVFTLENDGGTTYASLLWNSGMGGTLTTVASQSYPTSTNTLYTMQVVFSGSSISCYINGSILFGGAKTLSTYSSQTKHGVFNYNNGSTYLSPKIGEFLVHS